MTKPTRNHIALAGEFAVLSQLALRGYDANLTLGNTKGVDIFLSNPTTKKMKRLEVKTHSHNKHFINHDNEKVIGKWRMDKKHEEMNDPDLFFCFVSIGHVSSNFEFYTVPADIVANYVKQSHAEWSGDNQTRLNSDLRSFELIGSAAKENHPTPRAADYYHKWELLG